MRRSPSGGIFSGNCSTVTRPAGAANVISGAFEGRIVIVSCSESGGTHSSNDSEVTLSSARTEKAACARTQPSSKKPIASPKGTTRLCASMRADCGWPSTPAKKSEPIVMVNGPLMFVMFHDASAEPVSAEQRHRIAGRGRFAVAPGGYPVLVPVFDRVGERFTASLLSIGLMRLVFYFFTAKSHRDRSAGDL